MLRGGGGVTRLRRAPPPVQRAGVPLDELSLVLDIGGGGDGGMHSRIGGGGSDAFSITGLALEGAAWDRPAGCLCAGNGDASAAAGARADTIRESLPAVAMRWSPPAHVVSATAAGGGGAGVRSVDLPLYLCDARRELVSRVSLPAPADVPAAEWALRGVALVAWVRT